MSKKTILITGASGFTGRHFITVAKREGFRCCALCHHSNEAVSGADEVVVANLLNLSALEEAVVQTKPDYVLHLAAVAFVGHKDVGEVYQTNLIGTLNLLSAISKTAPDVKRIVIASSANIYGNSQELPISESTAPSPANHYGISKYAMEMASALYTNLPLVRVRPFNYTGLGQSSNFLIPKIVDAFRAGAATIELGNLDVARDFSDVRDVVTAYLRLLETNDACSVYNICSGHPVRLEGIIDRLNLIAGYEIQVRSNPEFMRSDEIKTLYGSSKRLEAAIGSYRQFSFDDTLEWMFKNKESS